VYSPSPGSWKTPLKLFLAVLALASCGILIGLGWRLTRHTPEETSLPSATAMDLGTALIPSSTPPQAARTYVWSVDTLSPPQHQLGYGLGAALIARFEAEHEELGRRLHFRALSPDRFTYRAPPRCQADMRCIYTELMRASAGPVGKLGDHFLTFIRAHRLNPAQAAELIIGFVQNIRYQEIPTHVPFGVIPPALVPAQDRGDCDSKAMLAVMLLRQAGIDAAILYSDPLKHAAVGVGLPGGGTVVRHGGQAFRYAEISASGWPIGMAPPQYDKPHLWQVLPAAELADGSTR
jgi:hypothetical protein